MQHHLYVDPGIKCTGLAVFASPGRDLSKARLVRAYGLRAKVLDDAIGHAAVSIRELPGGDIAPDGFVFERIARVTIELPQVYSAGKQSGDPNDLISIAAVAGAWACAASRAGVPFTLIRPAAWKGQLGKAITHDRMIAALTPPELAAYAGIDCIQSLMHNVDDAIAIGLAQQGRL